MNRFFCTLFFILVIQSVSGQDTLLFLTGKNIIVSSVDLPRNTISYSHTHQPHTYKTIDPERVFSVIYKDGHERIVYKTDSLDPLDFKVDEMRNFIYGVQDAKQLYRNHFFKVTGLAVGFGSAYFLNFYGIVGPPAYSTVVGAFSPNMEKILTFKVSGTASEELGISSGKYINEVIGKTKSPVIKKNQKLKIGHASITFQEDTGIDSAITVINSKFKCSLVHAANDNGAIKLIKSNTPHLINQPPYREGFEKRVRDYKIRSAMISGFIGLVVSSIALSVLLEDDN